MKSVINNAECRWPFIEGKLINDNFAELELRLKVVEGKLDTTMDCATSQSARVQALEAVGKPREQTEPLFTQADLDAALNKQHKEELILHAKGFNRAIKANNERMVAWINQWMNGTGHKRFDVKDVIAHILNGDPAPEE